MNQNTQFSNEQDMQKAHRAAYLIVGYVRSILTEEERDELDDWVCASDNNMQLFAELTDKNNLEKEFQIRESFNSEAAIQKILGKLPLKKIEPVNKTKKILFYAIAAMLLLALGIFFISRYYTNNNVTQPVIVEKQDLAPGSNKAFLTLPGGMQIKLDSSGNVLDQVLGVNVKNENGQLTYTENNSPIQYHTLTTPKGGQYQLTLPDGSHVWLNAASSITYPTAFLEKERLVEITGEAYFEVSRDEKKKFIVKANGIRTEVLGTQFNTNTYQDEAAPAVTLIEGSIKVKNTTGTDTTTITLKPGQQVILNATGKQIRQPDLESITAWRNGLFEFKKESIENIMRQVSRWYNVDIIYEGKVDYHFNASVDRKEPVSKLFQLLEMTDKVHFTIKGNTVIVKP